ncbi:hypothetical protein TNIN_304931 [Trichonephila inaurata madagascariensis]|uniref:Uncharacterized protein n=1 Tax=Trichonephila inaurata madagascariensis TaxID=2747483 RepID=A0A8X6IT12_9ARAC|nr:hypothetical protein TNIN_304931 [Trichonephila inaurata madagascariensis]
MGRDLRGTTPGKIEKPKWAKVLVNVSARTMLELVKIAEFLFFEINGVKRILIAQQQGERKVVGTNSGLPRLCKTHDFAYRGLKATEL